MSQNFPHIYTSADAVEICGNFGTQLILTQNSIREKLLLEAGVPGVADDEGSENGADTSSRAGNSDGGGSGSNELGGGVNIRLSCGGGQESLGYNIHCKTFKIRNGYFLDQFYPQALSILVLPFKLSPGPILPLELKIKEITRSLLVYFAKILFILSKILYYFHLPPYHSKIRMYIIWIRIDLNKLKSWFTK